MTTGWIAGNIFHMYMDVVVVFYFIGLGYSRQLFWSLKKHWSTMMSSQTHLHTLTTYIRRTSPLLLLILLYSTPPSIQYTNIRNTHNVHAPTPPPQHHESLAIQQHNRRTGEKPNAQPYRTQSTASKTAPSTNPSALRLAKSRRLQSARTRVRNTANEIPARVTRDGLLRTSGSRGVRY